MAEDCHMTGPSGTDPQASATHGGEVLSDGFDPDDPNDLHGVQYVGRPDAVVMPCSQKEAIEVAQQVGGAAIAQLEETGRLCDPGTVLADARSAAEVYLLDAPHHKPVFVAKYVRELCETLDGQGKDGSGTQLLEALRELVEEPDTADPELAQYLAASQETPELTRM